MILNPKGAWILLVFRNGVLKIPEIDAQQTRDCIPMEEVDLRMNFQRHNVDLAVWRRALATALKFDLPNYEQVFERLLREPQDTAEFLETFFGHENANRYREIMYQRIVLFRSMVESMIAGDTADTEKHFQALNHLADQLADFFYELSPVYPKEEWSQLLREYELLMYYQAYAVATGNYEGEIELFDRILDQITVISDHAADVVAVALGWSDAGGELPAPPAPPAPPAGSMGDSRIRLTTAIWRFPGH